MSRESTPPLGRTNATMGKRAALVAWSFPILGLGCGQPAASPHLPEQPIAPAPIHLPSPKMAGRKVLFTRGPRPERPEAIALVPRDAVDSDPVVWTFAPPFFGLLFDDTAQLLYDVSETAVVSGRRSHVQGGVACSVESRRTFSNAVGACLNCNLDLKGIDGQLLTPLCFVGTPAGLSWVESLPNDFVELDPILRSPPAIPTSRAAYHREDETLTWKGQPLGPSAYCVERSETLNDGPMKERVCFDERRGLYAETVVTPSVSASMTFRSRSAYRSCAD